MIKNDRFYMNQEYYRKCLCKEGVANPCLTAPPCKPPDHIFKKRKSNFKSQFSILDFSSVVRDNFKMLIGIALLCVAGIITTMLSNLLVVRINAHTADGYLQLFTGILILLFIFKMVSNILYRLVCYWLNH